MQPALSSPARRLKKLKRIQKTAKQNQCLILNPHKQWEKQQTMNTKIAEPPPKNGQQPMPPRVEGGGGAWIKFTGQIINLDTAEVKTQIQLSLYKGFLFYVNVSSQVNNHIK